MDLQVEYLNKILYNKLKYSGPKFLYKYRPFDQYTFDMLDKGYLYLCPAEKLDDKSECNTSIDVNSLIDLETNNLKRVCVYQIMEMICSYSTEDNFEVIKSKLEIIMNHTGTLKPNFLLDLSFELEKIAPGIDIAPIVNWIINIPEKLDDLAIKPQMESFLSLSMNAKQEIGICSLCAFCSICASDDVERI